MIAITIVMDIVMEIVMEEKYKRANSSHSSFYSFRSCGGSECNDYSYDDNYNDDVNREEKEEEELGGTIIRSVAAIERLPTSSSYSDVI